EMGIPMAGLGLAELHPELEPMRYRPEPEGCWIERGDTLLTYTFRPQKKLLEFSDDRIAERTFTIVSPISGVLLEMRDENTVSHFGPLQYQWCEEKRLPILLVPDEEPLPDLENFYTYDSMTRWLRARFDLLPFRHPNRRAPQRLEDFLAEHGHEV